MSEKSTLMSVKSTLKLILPTLKLILPTLKLILSTLKLIFPTLKLILPTLKLILPTLKLAKRKEKNHKVAPGSFRSHLYVALLNYFTHFYTLCTIQNRSSILIYSQPIPYLVTISRQVVGSSRPLFW